MTGLLDIEVDYLHQQGIDPKNLPAETVYALYPEMAILPQLQDRLDQFMHKLKNSPLPINKVQAGRDVYKMSLLISASMNHGRTVQETQADFIGLGIIDNRNLGEDNNLNVFYIAEIFFTASRVSEYMQLQGSVASLTFGFLIDKNDALSQLGRSISATFGNKLLLGSLGGVIFPHIDESVLDLQGRRKKRDEGLAATRKLIHDMQELTSLTLFD